MNRRLATLLLVIFGVGLTGASGAAAATVADAGWWDRDSDALIPKLDPPAEGDLRVGNDPTGTSAVLAVRYQLGDGEERPVLVLRVSGDPAEEGVSLVACPATSPWEGSHGGPLAEAPEADCEIGAALGLVAADGATVSFDLTTIAGESVVDVVIAPAPEGDNPVADTFTIDFEAPTDADLVTHAVAPPPPEVPAVPDPGGNATTPGPSQPTGGATGNPSLGPPSSGTSGPTAPVGGDFSVDGAPVTPPAADTTPGPGLAPGSPIDSSGEVGAAAPISSEDSGDRRAIGLAIAAAIVALGAHLWRADRARAVLAAGPTMGGLGPFVRQRSEPAPDVA